MDSRSRQKGFTTVELVIVMAVIAILATVLIPTFSNLITQAEDVKALQEASNVWKSYTISHPTDFSNDVVSIQVGNRFFTARQGKLANTHTNTPADGAIAVITADSTNGFVCVIHDISKKDCNICGAKHEHSFIEANDNKLPFCECGIPQPHDCGDVDLNCRCDQCGRIFHNELNTPDSGKCSFCDYLPKQQ